MSSATTPREVNDVAIVAGGIALWVIALLIALIARADQDVIGVCGAGIALGLWGLRYVKRRADRRHHEGL
jgi:hypothetical protein